jgi:hypothetical protein
VNEAQPTKPFWRSLAVFFGGGFVLLTICGSLLWFFAFPDLCGNDNQQEIISPNGTLKAVQFRRSCGATTGYSTHVSILPASRRLPNEAGNVFVVGDEPTVIVRWIDDRHLSISGGGAGTAFVHLTDFRGVHITYD